MNTSINGIAINHAKRRFTCRTPAILLLVLVVVLCSACITPKPHPEPPNDVDTRRLAIVAADPILKGHAGINEALDMGGFVGPNGNLRRAMVHSGDEEPVAGRTLTQAWANTRQFIEDLQNDSWEITAISCQKNGGANVKALKNFGDFTTALTGGAYSAERDGDINEKSLETGAIFTIYIPYHTEPPSPWLPNKPLIGTLCTDKKRPPKEDGPSLEDRVSSNSNYGSLANV